MISRKSVKLHIISFFLLIFLFLFSHSSSPNAGDWESEREKINDLYRKDCDTAWKILWSEAKAGNVEARYWLAFLIQWEGLSMPGSTDDYISLTNDITILSVHSSSYTLPERKEQKEEDNSYSLFFKDLAGAKNFLECTKIYKNSKCTDIAIEENLVPTFEEYAKKIDVLVKSGYKPRCELNPQH